MNLSKYIFGFIVFCVLSSCATIFTGIKNDIIIDSFPQNATVKINGVNVGETPLKISVTRTIFKKKNIEISKENFITTKFHLTRELNYVTFIGTIYFPIDFLTGAAVYYYPKFYNIRLASADTSIWNEAKINNSESYHVWNKKMPITWDFFRGYAEYITTDGTMQTTAVTSSWFTYAYSVSNNVMNLYSFSIFDTQKSWVKKRSKSTLMHERAHFDISEIYSRKFKRKLLEYNWSENENINDIVQKIYNEYQNKLFDTQNKYDTETAHGMNKEMQKTWEKKIEEELITSMDMEKPFYKINLKK